MRLSAVERPRRDSQALRGCDTWHRTSVAPLEMAPGATEGSRSEPHDRE